MDTVGNRQARRAVGRDFRTLAGGAGAFRGFPFLRPGRSASEGAQTPRFGASSSGNSFYRAAGKTMFDIAFVLLVVFPVLAVLLPLVLAISLDGHSPFFGQERIGRNGRVFRMWKLRTMVPDADLELEKLLARDPAASAEWQRHQKLRRDPRVTRIGVLLRKTSLDELPQFWNVLVGDMSVVGPRPMMPSQCHLYPGVEYFAVRPGITGYWQTSVRNDASFPDRADFDAKYYRELSFATDLKLIMRTVSVVLNGTGY